MQVQKQESFSWNVLGLMKAKNRREKVQVTLHNNERCLRDRWDGFGFRGRWWLSVRVGASGTTLDAGERMLKFLVGNQTGRQSEHVHKSKLDVTSFLSALGHWWIDRQMFLYSGSQNRHKSILRYLVSPEVHTGKHHSVQHRLWTLGYFMVHTELTVA